MALQNAKDNKRNLAVDMQINRQQHVREPTPEKRSSSNLMALESQNAIMSNEEIKELEGTKTNAELLGVINEALDSMVTSRSDYSSFYKDAVKFDPVSKVVDILLD
jgi:hypothetical protein